MRARCTEIGEFAPSRVVKAAAPRFVVQTRTNVTSPFAVTNCRYCAMIFSVLVLPIDGA